MALIKLVFVTGNAQKLQWVRGLVGDIFDIENVKLHIPELQGTVEEIVTDKCRRAADIVCFEQLSNYLTHFSR
jgi:inosine triphosphate pyrophosphatase